MAFKRWEGTYRLLGPCIAAAYLAGAGVQAAEAFAGPVYRCVAKDGSVVFNDQPSLAGHACTLLDIHSPPPLRANAVAKTPPLSISAAKKIAADALMDPEATRFRDVYRSRSGAVCGNLNAKNSFGAYTGYAGFVVTPSRQVSILGQGNDQLSRAEIRDHCRS
ncbi:DUF4124 domain-containing protein [Massilia timonae]|uniref:DUF4124 domain-containing protein n=1 Tax=Massilia timonae TaxID=47229 RepID=UPI0028996FB7|nr:DUF4124 domain-containing protein [Massilia timonae]